MLQNIRKKISNVLVPKAKNVMNLPNSFLRYGNRGVVTPDWSYVEMSDLDHYSGYGYATINNRANKVAKTAKENVRTQGSKEEHPYLSLIRESKYFSETDFWYSASTYLDLEGIYYILAVRSYEGERIGMPQYFKLLNPYEVRRVINPQNKEVEGYIETKGGLTREIPPEMIIPIKKLNPFDNSQTFAMTDASKGSQFNLKTASNYTRHAVRNNQNAPGIISTDIELDDEQFTNFVARMKAHNQGEPIYSNSGSVKWEGMQIDLSKSALKDINEVNRAELFAVSGVSKTILGIEESGTTRETARVQKELNMEDQILPQIQSILDALNLDYLKVRSMNKSKGILVVDNPMANDIDADIKEVDLKDKQLDLYQKLINKGVDRKLASDYVKGDIDIDSLNIEKMELPMLEPKTDKEEKKENSIVKNSLIGIQESALKNAILSVDEKLVGYAMGRLSDLVENSFSLADLLSWNRRDEAENELRGILSTFYSAMFSLEGNETILKREADLGMTGKYEFDIDSKDYVKKISDKVAKSHVKTISDDIYKTALESAISGKSLVEVQSELKSKYTGVIADTRAKTIARTETNRAFTRAQFEADRQFIEQNNLKAYKEWRCRGTNPCAICLDLQAMGKIPFNSNFASLGSSRTADGLTMKFNFEDVVAGNAHPNCACDYELVVEM